MFDDVKELQPGAALRLQARLREAAAAVARPQYDSSHPSRPSQAHISPAWSSQANSSEFSSSHAPSHETSARDSHADPTTARSATAINIPANAATPRYVLLCVNTRRSRTLKHVNVSTVMNDEFLFDALRGSYNLARKTHDWTLPLIPHFAPLLKRLWWYVGDMSILTPTSADYVRVCLSQIILKYSKEAV